MAVNASVVCTKLESADCWRVHSAALFEIKFGGMTHTWRIPTACESTALEKVMPDRVCSE